MQRLDPHRRLLALNQRWSITQFVIESVYVSCVLGCTFVLGVLRDEWLLLPFAATCFAIPIIRMVLAMAHWADSPSEEPETDESVRRSAEQLAEWVRTRRDAPLTFSRREALFAGVLAFGLILVVYLLGAAGAFWSGFTALVLAVVWWRVAKWGLQLVKRRLDRLWLAEFDAATSSSSPGIAPLPAL